MKMNKYKWIILSISAIFPIGIILISTNLVLAIIKELRNSKKNNNPPKTIART